jgi:FlaA1/EpsC-like NDP-sugar epimerase
MFKNKTILITGGTGSWGTELIAQLLKLEVKEIKILARNEFNMVSTLRKFNDPRLKMEIGDVRDYGKVKHACKNVNYVFHLSALKHVPVCEDFPYEAVKTNINGTRNIIRASIDNGVDIMVDVSSDKAVLPVNTYGMTKAVGEKLTLNASKLSKKTEFMVIRGGNVMGTAGSVIPLWISQIKEQNRITITDYDMTRYFITLSEAIKLLFVAMESKINGGTFVMKMPACKIIDLARVLIKWYGNRDTIIHETGIRPGEKLDEVLISKHEVKKTFVWDENYYLIHQTLDWYSLPKVDFEEYSSRTYLMNEDEIKTMLEKGGFLK